ncbi:hypothetical protein ABZ128_31230 [Streptomyces sp. NPDC006326]|uniref:hypothetical protein n=1 Tax=Streptomyces sp. NPDC006326 TaxID=3156752 RepID=UPI0033AA2D2A
MEDQGGAGGAPLHDEGDSERRRPHVKPSIMDRRRRERESSSDTAADKQSDETRQHEGPGKRGTPAGD